MDLRYKATFVDIASVNKICKYPKSDGMTDLNSYYFMCLPACQQKKEWYGHNLVILMV